MDERLKKDVEPHHDFRKGHDQMGKTVIARIDPDSLCWDVLVYRIDGFHVEMRRSEIDCPPEHSVPPSASRGTSQRQH